MSCFWETEREKRHDVMVTYRKSRPMLSFDFLWLLESKSHVCFLAKRKKCISNPDNIFSCDKPLEGNMLKLPMMSCSLLERVNLLIVMYCA
ncbi:hypothetical protein CEXT_396431 [Caerostris extrusa]|uniref:Uncharacterized protein n=1 Tax=Caerostris extrusa TaxID=172846 RepID=A0AAV4Y3W5_CAEEX|nr:hypothetical protein CEXT_396431 [Caerostris extrusa]